MSSGVIADLLNITNSVKTHLLSVYRKLGVEDRDAAVERAGRLGRAADRADVTPRGSDARPRHHDPIWWYPLAQAIERLRAWPLRLVRRRASC